MITDEFVLPLTPVKSENQDPKNLIIFSKPKTGKTLLLSKLPNCLILDLEKGSKYVDALKVEIDSIDDLVKVGKKIKEAGNPYKYIAVDTTTALEELCVPYAEKLYAATPMGKNWFDPEKGGKKDYGSILNLPNGAGYQYLRQAVEKVLSFIETLAPHIILVAHVKDTVLEKAGSEFNSLDIDLTGKLKRIIASKSDAIGYLYRKGNKNILSFKTSDEVACGARCNHLKNKEFVISEMDADNNYVANWNQIYQKEN